MDDDDNETKQKTKNRLKEGEKKTQKTNTTNIELTRFRLNINLGNVLRLQVRLVLFECFSLKMKKNIKARRNTKRTYRL